MRAASEATSVQVSAVRTRDALEAHPTIAFTALTVARETQDRTGLAIRRLCPLNSATTQVNGTVRAFRPPSAPASKILDDLQNGRDLRH